MDDQDNSPLGAMAGKMPDLDHGDGGPAFPSSIEEGPYGTRTAFGMSLRDWFAGMTLQGLLAARIALEEIDPKFFARQAFKTADAMLKARKES